jgi:NADH-quinone oxidoreductase subunit C
MVPITRLTIASALQEQFGGLITEVSGSDDMLTVTIDNRSNIEIMQWLMEHPLFQFRFLTDLCGVHFPERTGEELSVVYHLHSLVNNIRIRLKLYIPYVNPTVKSVTSLFQSANWMERETYDFFGIRFEAHPNLKRILNVDNMNYFPLLRQYPLEDQGREDKNDKFFGR